MALPLLVARYLTNSLFNSAIFISTCVCDFSTIFNFGMFSNSRSFFKCAVRFTCFLSNQWHPSLIDLKTIFVYILHFSLIHQLSLSLSIALKESFSIWKSIVRTLKWHTILVCLYEQGPVFASSYLLSVKWFIPLSFSLYFYRESPIHGDVVLTFRGRLNCLFRLLSSSTVEFWTYSL